MARDNRERETAAFRPEDEIDEVFARANPNPARTGCPGKDVLRSAARKALPIDHPVFEHLAVGTMSGTNPDGSSYHDPGIKWISYFNGGEALHAFPRASFGTPQSLGCVELPEASAKKVWPYTPIGTLVTIEN